jgi:hypothetical protein
MQRTALDYPRFSVYGPIRPHAVVAMKENTCVVHGLGRDAVAIEGNRGRWVSPILRHEPHDPWITDDMLSDGALYFAEKQRSYERMSRQIRAFDAQT